MVDPSIARRPLTRTSNEIGYAILRNFPPPDLEQAWRVGLSRVDFPAHYDSPECFHEPYWTGKCPFAILAVTQGAVVGGLTGLHERNEVVSGLPSRPQIFVDPAADSQIVLDCLARGLLAEAGTADLATVYCWSWRPLVFPQRYGFLCREMEGNVVIELADGPKTLFAQLDRKRRANIRLAIRNGLSVRQAATPEDLDEFYRVYLSWRQTKRKKIEGEPIDRIVFEYRMQHPESFRIFLACHGGKIIAGINLRFWPGGLVEYANNSSLEDFLHLRPNDFLVWSALEWACQQGFRRFSLGGSHQFLREFGGRIVPIWRYRVDRTLLRRHDLREAGVSVGRALLHKFSRSTRKTLRSFFRTKVATPWRSLPL
jgi:GNAT acetyltransferase-like protein